MLLPLDTPSGPETVIFLVRVETVTRQVARTFLSAERAVSVTVPLRRAMTRPSDTEAMFLLEEVQVIVCAACSGSTRAESSSRPSPARSSTKVCPFAA